MNLVTLIFSFGSWKIYRGHLVVQDWMEKRGVWSAKEKSNNPWDQETRMNHNVGRKFGFGENRHIFRIDGNKWEWVCLYTLLVIDCMDVKYSVNRCLIFSFWCSKPFTYGKEAQGRWQRCGKSTQEKWKAIVQG